VAWRFNPQSDGNGIVVGGTLQSLGVIKANRGGISQSGARDINDLGQVAGNSTAGGTSYSAFRHSSGVGMQNLGSLAGGVFDFVGINIDGEVVGRDASAGRAFLYTDQFGMFELDTRVSGLPGGMLGKLGPCKINGDGDVCGGGGAYWFQNAFVLRRTAP
jgi:probable HAF family extracellular repeat protein